MKNYDVYTITGEEQFTDNEQPIGISMLDFWKFECSNVYDLQDEVSEFIVTSALGLTKAFNKDSWTRWDISYPYKNDIVKIEVKTTSYYHSWQTEKSEIKEQRAFGIAKSNSKYDERAKVLAGEMDKVSGENVLERPSDLYVFCLNTGRNRKDAFPLEMKNWEFYIVSTAYINSTFKEQKSVSLTRLKKLGIKPVPYSEIKNTVEQIADGVKATS